MDSRLKAIFRSKKVVLEEEIIPASIAVALDGRIKAVLRGEDMYDWDDLADEVFDVGQLVIMPGVVDSHVHFNEPGRTHWEGFWTGTRAAAAGGVTTVVDMPLNSIPPTTSAANLRKKIDAATGNIHVDVAFWGGLVPENKKCLHDLIEAGVVGFKSFLCPSGVDEFSCVTYEDLRVAFQSLQGVDTVLAFHAEIPDETVIPSNNNENEVYETFLKTRPPEMETKAVEMVSGLCREFRVRCHIVHASSHQVLHIVEKAKTEGLPLTAETCHHYLTLNSEDVKIGATAFKCCPPIRGSENRERLWGHISSGSIDMVVSDHSPCPPDLKGDGDFIAAWGGISSVQYGLSLFWTEAHKRGMPLTAVSKLLSKAQASICRLDTKGSIKAGKDADLVIFDPDETFVVSEENTFHRHKITPYLGMKLRGTVVRTVIRGKSVFLQGSEFPLPQGEFLLRNREGHVCVRQKEN